MKKLFILSVILGVLLASAPVLSQKKGTQPNVDPEFQKFWGEFVALLEKKNYQELVDKKYVCDVVKYIDEFEDCANLKLLSVRDSSKSLDLCRPKESFFKYVSKYNFVEKKIKVKSKGLDFDEITFSNLEIISKNDETFKYRECSVDEEENSIDEEENSVEQNEKDFGADIPNGTNFYKIVFDISYNQGIRDGREIYYMGRGYTFTFYFIKIDNTYKLCFYKYYTAESS